MVKSEKIFLRTFGAIILILALFGFYGCESGGKEKDSTRAALPNEGEILPAFKLKTLAGGEFSSDGQKGKPMVINFFASWCAPCRAEAASFEKTYLVFKELGVEYVGVAVQDSPESVKKFVDEFGLTFPVGLDDSGDISRQYKIYGLPKTFIVGKDGRCSFIHTGALSVEELTNEVKKVL